MLIQLHRAFKTRLAILLLCSMATAEAVEMQSHAAIIEQVRHYVEAQAPAGSDFQIDVSPLDSHLQLARCDGPLEAFSLSDKNQSGPLTIGVRCLGSMGWTIYTRAKLAIYQEVLVLRDSVPEGAPILADNVDFSRQEINSLRGAYLTAADQAVGKVARRNLSAGSVLTDKVLIIAKVIKRGQQVEIRLNNPSLHVQMSGVAATDAGIGQRVQVRNTQSNRLIEGVVVAPGVVEVN